MQIDTKNLLEVAVKTARLAGQRLKGISQRRINSDAGNDVKLQEDVESEMFIRNELQATGIPILGEEIGGDISLIADDKLYWIVDPIDGTYNYLRGIPGVCVSIALMKGWKGVVGAIYDFTSDEMFAGSKDLGLFVNDEKVSPNWAKSVSQAVLMTGFPSATDYSSPALQSFVSAVQKFKKVRMCGSAALAASWVAVGRADSYREIGVKLWDIAAGLSLIEAAGGVYTLKSIPTKENPLCVDIQIASCKEFLID